MNSDPARMRDVFISHSQRDKEAFVEPLVVALGAAGIDCWYDSLELVPGDSLLDKINHGLTHSKLILLCLSEAFFDGRWAPKELKAAVSLADASHAGPRLVPLILGEPDTVLRRFPIPLSDMLYVQWSDGLSVLVDKITHALREVDELGADYWAEEAQQAYTDGRFERAALYARRSLAHDDIENAHVLLIASLLHLGHNESVYLHIYNNRERWLSEDLTPPDIDIVAYDYAQDTITERIRGDEVQSHDFPNAILGYLTHNINGGRAWQYLRRLSDKEAFKYERKSIVFSALMLGRSDALEWVRAMVEHESDSEVRKALATTSMLLSMHDESMRQDLVELSKQMLADGSSDVREMALLNVYFHSDDGSAYALAALDDEDYGVRDVAVNLLTGYTNLIPKEDMGFEQGERRPADPALTEDLVLKILYEEDAAVFDSLLEAIKEGRVELPAHVDPNRITKKDEMLGPNTPQVRLLGIIPTADAHARLLEFACNDPRADTRKYAYEGLKEDKYGISDDQIRQMIAQEDSRDNYEELYELLLEKGSSEISDLLEMVGGWAVKEEREVMVEEVLTRLFEWGESERAAKVIAACLEAGQFKPMARKLKWMIRDGSVEAATVVVEHCLEEDSDVVVALLAGGLLTAVEVDTLESYRDADDPTIAVAALRACEKKQPGSGIPGLANAYARLREDIAGRVWQSIWAVLSAIDGELEFGSRSRATAMLEELYEELNKDPDGSFPLRETWERLRLLGSPRHHAVYSESEPSVPYDWPDATGPFYGIKEF